MKCVHRLSRVTANMYIFAHVADHSILNVKCMRNGATKAYKCVELIATLKPIRNDCYCVGFSYSQYQRTGIERRNIIACTYLYALHLRAICMEQLFSPVFKEFLKTFPLSLSPSPLSFCLSPVSFSIAYFFLGSHLTSTFLCAVKLYFYLVTCQKVCQTFEYMERVSDHLANIPMPLYVQICI